MKENVIQLLKQKHLDLILNLVEQLNTNIPIIELKKRQTEMFLFSNYRCFGLFKKQKLIGVSSGWITIRHYSGKQLEIDNVIIDNLHQSKGYGKIFVNEIENWAKLNNCNTIELNTYVQNSKSHKFYFNQEFHILGYHFQKHI